MSGIIIYRGWIPLFTQLDGIMWWSSMVYHKFIAPNSNRWPNNWWSNSFHETTLWVLPPGTFLGWSMFIHPKILLYCSMYGLFIQHHPTKWHQCWWFHAASLETRNPRGLMVPSGPPTSFHPILDMAQFSLTESLPPKKKWMLKAWQKIWKNDQLFAIPIGKNPVFRHTSHIWLGHPLSRRGDEAPAPKKRVRHIEARIQSRHLKTTALEDHPNGKWFFF